MRPTSSKCVRLNYAVVASSLLFVGKMVDTVDSLLCGGEVGVDFQGSISQTTSSSGFPRQGQMPSALSILNSFSRGDIPVSAVPDSPGSRIVVRG